MSRRTSRETAMKILYQMEFHNDLSEEGINELLDESTGSSSDKTYIKTICKDVSTKKTELDTLIEKHLKGWKISRISRVDLTILRIALCEMLDYDDIPVSVSINEAVELAKKYSTPESASFINGVLSSADKNKSKDQEN